MKIVVIGAGIVGLSSAYWLARDGHEVTVVDRENEVGRGASFANGGQLSYSYVAPMAAPSVLHSLPKYLLKPDSPVRFTPRADPAQWRWILAFLRACTAERSALTTARLIALSFHSRDSLATMRGEAPLEFDHASNGKLVLQSSREGLDEAAAQVALQATMGCEQQVVSAQECLDLEPGLQSISSRIVGGVLTPSEEVGDCRMLCEALQRTLAGAPFSVRFMLGCAVEKVVRSGSRATEVVTGQGSLQADLYVLAAGVQSPLLARPLGINVAVQPVRGYSISARVRSDNRAPVRSITDTYRKTVYAPIGERLRVAGFAEVGVAANGAGPAPVRADRIEVLKQDLEAIFPDVCEMEDVRPWSGMRPVTPTGLPFIGRTRVDNVFLNVGQGALGFTLAAGSAHLLSDIVAGRTPAIPAEFYDPITNGF
jgi:D-amino-acid dehydrogenase